MSTGYTSITLIRPRPPLGLLPERERDSLVRCGQVAKLGGTLSLQRGESSREHLCMNSMVTLSLLKLRYEQVLHSCRAVLAPADYAMLRTRVS